MKRVSCWLGVLLVIVAVATLGAPSAFAVEMTRSNGPLGSEPLTEGDSDEDDDGEADAAGDGNGTGIPSGPNGRGSDLDPNAGDGPSPAPGDGSGSPSDGSTPSPGDENPPPGGVGNGNGSGSPSGGGSGGGSPSGGGSGGGGDEQGGQPQDDANQRYQDELRRRQEAERAYNRGYEDAIRDERLRNQNQYPYGNQPYGNQGAQPGGSGNGTPSGGSGASSGDPAGGASGGDASEAAADENTDDGGFTEDEIAEEEPELAIDEEKMAALAPLLADVGSKLDELMKQETSAREDAEAKESVARRLCAAANLVEEKNNYFAAGYAETLREKCNALQDEAATKLRRADTLKAHLDNMREELDKNAGAPDVSAEFAEALRLLSCHLAGGSCLTDWLAKHSGDNT